MRGISIYVQERDYTWTPMWSYLVTSAGFGQVIWKLM
jgi:hypothetical protein